VRNRPFNASIAVAAMLLVSACAPITRVQTQWDFTPYAPGELKQERDGITVEIGSRSAFKDPSFAVRVFRCDRAGRMLVDGKGQPLIEDTLLAGPGQLWRQVQITNRTRHVLRMNSVVLRLFDPGATQYEPLTLDDVRADLAARHSCGITPASEATMRSVKIFNRNIEVVPETTTGFWVAFKPATLAVEGTWKFAVYEIPSVVDDAGRPTRTTRFEMRIVAKSTQVTTVQDSMFAPPRVVGSSDAAAGTTPSPYAAPVAVPPNGSAASSSSTPAVPTAQSSPSPANVPATAANGTPAQFSRETIARAQARLNELRFNAGPADGLPGAKTKDAIRKFQASRKLKATGELDSTTLTALGLQ